MESILTSIKKLLGIDEFDTSFDMDIIIHINSMLSVLTQLGVGPVRGFRISDKSATWSEFIPTDNAFYFEDVKTYLYLRVKLIFDPPLSSSVIDSMKAVISEIEWRLNVAAETSFYGEEEIQNGE